MNSSPDWDDPASAFEPAESVYLLSHSVGRLPLATATLVEQQFLSPWRRGADEPWNNWLAAIAGFRDALASLLGTETESLCPQTNLSNGLGRILGALPVPAGRETILLSEDDFPSTGYVLQQAQRLGYRLRYLPAGADVSDTQLWLDQLDAAVGMVFITHVQSNSGRRAPVAELLPVLRERGIISIVDIAQSAGVIPIDLNAWAADFVIGSCVKWLCGGPGAGYLWVNPDMIPRCEPLDVGWFSHEDPFEFNIHDFRYHPTALRFWGGTPSVLPFVSARAGIDTLAAIGVEQAHTHNRQLRAQLLDGVGDSALVSPLQAEHTGGTMVLHFGESQGQVVHGLLAEHVAFDVREAGIRLSPHVYNSADEIAAIIAAVTECRNGE